MKARIKKTGAVKSDAVSHRAWRETIDDFDQALETAFDQETEEAAVELWLETPQLFIEHQDGLDQSSSPLRRVAIGGLGLKRAAVSQPQSSWDEDFADAQKHVASVLKQMGS
jgi:hypothetical protein